MSALPPKADMFSVKIDVRLVPLADSLVPRQLGSDATAPLRAWTDIVTPLLQEHEPSEFRILHQVREPQKAVVGYPR